MLPFKTKTQQRLSAIGLTGLVTALLLLWFRGGFAAIHVDTDFGRDLSEISNILAGEIVWLGPQLSVGFPITPLYFYLFAPAIWLSGGQAEAMILLNLFFAGLSLWLFGWLSWKDHGIGSLSATLVMGAVPWWLMIAAHPGNGYTYALLLFAGLTCLWFELPILLSTFFLSLAIAFHPLAVFSLLILAYEWWRQGHRARQAVLMLGILVGPWTPLIAFEFITKGYLFRQWMNLPGSEVSVLFQADNVLSILALATGHWLFALICLVLAARHSQARFKVWLGLTLVTIAGFGSLSALPPHYLLGIACLTCFVLIQGLSMRPAGWFILLLLGGWSVFFHLSQPLPHTARSLPQLHQVVQAITSSNGVTPTQRVAILAALSSKTEVPQADDYRFLLRMAGYQVLPVHSYHQAEVLVLISEVPNFPWMTWSTWEIEQFGQKTLVTTQQVGQTTIAIYHKP